MQNYGFPHKIKTFVGILSCFGSFQGTLAAKDYYNDYKEQACASGDLLKPAPIETVISPKHLFELYYVTSAYGLSADPVTFLRKELGWKKKVLDLMSLVTKVSCRDTNVLSQGYVNVAKNLFLYYLYSKSQNGSDPVPPQWQSIIEALTKCAKGIGPLLVTSKCGVPQTVHVIPEGTEKPISIVREIFDREVDKGGEAVTADMILESIWWMFSTTFARCYGFSYPHEDAMVLFRRLFSAEFLQIFHDRWTGAGALADVKTFDFVFGPVEVHNSYKNLKKCAFAANQQEGIRHPLIRPVTPSKKVNERCLINNENELCGNSQEEGGGENQTDESSDEFPTTAKPSSSSEEEK